MTATPMVRQFTMWLGVCSAIGIITVLPANRIPQERFSSYVAAKIDRKTSESAFAAKIVSVGFENDLDFIHFTDSQFGIAGDYHGHLYLTNDGGGTWQAKDLPHAGYRNNVYFPSIAFGSANSGFAIAQQYNKPGEDICLREASLLRTRDRGGSWQTLFTRKCVELIQVSFFSEREGWVVGHEFIPGRGVTRARLLILHTPDNGNSWRDVSADANRVIEEGLGEVGSPAGIVATNKGAATIVTRNGYVIDTADSGVRWSRSGSLALNRLLPELKRTENGSVLITGGIDGTHGTAGMIAQRNDRYEWSGSWFKDISLKDAIVLSKSEILVCGSLLPVDRERLLNGEREGVVLYSKNAGRDWLPIFRSSEIRSINSLGKAAQRVIWATAPRGQLVKISPATLFD